MSAAERRLFELRLASNAGRVANLAGVAEEQAGSAAVARVTQSDVVARKAARAAEKAAAGASSSSAAGKALQEMLLDDSVDAAAQRAGLSSAVRTLGAKDVRNDFDEDADVKKNNQYRAFLNKGQAAALPLDHYRAKYAQESSAAVDDVGMSAYVDPARVQVLKASMAKQEGKRAKARKRKRKAYNPDEDVSYISEANRKYNIDLEKSYGKYTKEIKANLERGTALK